MALLDTEESWLSYLTETMKFPETDARNYAQRLRANGFDADSIIAITSTSFTDAINVLSDCELKKGHCDIDWLLSKTHSNRHTRTQR